MQRGDPLALTRALVRIDSRNPHLAPGAPGEAPVAHALAEVLRAWGFDVRMMDSGSGRPNVIARMAGRTPGQRSLMFNGHMDVVGTDGMTHAPFEATEQEGRLYGRGSTDMKAGVAAMCAAAARAVDEGLEGEIIICAVADEEFRSAGTAALVRSGVRADAAVVTEPTCLAIAPAHKGFVWFDISIAGRAAHGSRYDIGVDAIKHAGLLLAELDLLEMEELSKTTHPLLGRASLHASLIQGGSGMSTYPDHCRLQLERRTVPGESVQNALRQIQQAADRVKSRHPSFSAAVKVEFSQEPSDVATDAPIVRSLEAAMLAEGETVLVQGLSAWTDAALLNAAGIPAICYGPGNIALAHAAEEYVEVNEIERACKVLTRLALDWTSGRS